MEHLNNMSPWLQFLVVFWDYLILASPYLWLGILFSGVIHQFMPTQLIVRWMSGTKFSQVFKAALIGVPLPLCSCSVIPTAVTLRKMGASKSATSAFLISTPESGVDSVMVTYAMMDFPMTVIRPVAAFLSAFLAGGINLFFEKKEKVKFIENSSSAITQVVAPKFRWKGVFTFACRDLMDDMVGWLILGLVMGALITWLVPSDFFIGMDPFLGKIGVALISTLLYICASASTPLAASLIMKGMSPGTALLLLLLGPATNISNILVLQKTLGKRTIAINIFSMMAVAFIGSELVDYAYQNFWDVRQMKVFTDLSSLSLEHEHQHSIFETICAVSFCFLLLTSVWRVFIRPYLTGSKAKHQHDHEKAACCDHKKECS
jgi:uncharacterized membrane protein YraQ (UPF0718 family)